MTQTSSQPQPSEPANIAKFQPRRSFMARAALDVMGKWGARIGMVWILAVAFMAIFAPLLANSHPYLIKTDDGWSSPMIRHFEPSDVVLLLSALVGIALLCCWRMGFGSRVALWVWFTAWCVPFVGWAKVVTLLGEVDRSIGSKAIIIALSALALIVIGLIVVLTLWRSRANWQANIAVLITVIVVTAVRVTLLEPNRSVVSMAIILVAATIALFVIACIAVLMLWLSSANWLATSVVMLVALVVAAVAIMSPVRPPTAVVYSQYREGLKSGAIETAYMAPIPYSPTDRLRDRSDQRLVEPGWMRWFRSAPVEADLKKQYFYALGTTTSGEDVASRMIHASRIALAVGFIATGIAVVIGIIVGGLMGYFAGWVDLLGWRLVEIFSAIPSLILLIAFTAFYGRNLYLIMVIIGLTGWVGYAVFVRAEFLRLRQQDYVVAARAAGLPLWSILFRHMLPNGVTPVIVNASFGVASAILMESTLSFLGLGLVEEPSWGQMLDQIRGLGGGFAWWMAIFPGLAIFLTVFAYNLVGEALRDAIDPRLQARV